MRPRQSKDRPAAIFILLSSLLFFLAGCPRTEPVREERFLGGTLVDITAYGGGPGARVAVSDAFSLLDRVEQAIDPRREGNPAEALRRGRPVHLPPEMAGALSVALAVAEASSGAFDPTIGGLTDLWGFSREDPSLPSPTDTRKTLAKVGFRRLRLDGDLAVPPPDGVWLDLGGVGEGYAVDQAVRLLKERGIEGGIVNSSGDMVAFGRKDGGGEWRIGIQHPDRPQDLLGVLVLREGAVCTSGDYQAFFERDGVRYHHVLDPATGYPARGIRSATVVAGKGVLADALATALFVLGPEKGLKLLAVFPGAEAVLVKEGGEIVTSPGMGKDIKWEPVKE